MQVSHVEKNMVEQQSSTVPNSQTIRSTVGLTLATPGLVFFTIPTSNTSIIQHRKYYEGVVKKDENHKELIESRVSHCCTGENSY